MVNRIATEAECENAIIDAAILAGWRVHAERKSRTKDGGHLTAIKGHRGFPDLTMVRGEQILFVELKRDKTGKIGPGQQEWIDALDLGGNVRAFFLWVPSQQDQFIKRIQRR